MDGEATNGEDLQRQLYASERMVASLLEAIVFARYEILEARKWAIAADDHLRRAVGGIDREDPLDWIC